MMRSLYSGVTGLKNHQTRMDVIGNNIANVNTVAFKASRVTFNDIYSETIRPATATTSQHGGMNPMQIGLGMNVSSIDVMHGRSAAMLTSMPLDVSIAGDGFFTVSETGQSTQLKYTRAGNFAFDAPMTPPTGATEWKSNLLDANGNYVMGYMMTDPKNPVVPTFSSPTGSPPNKIEVDFAKYDNLSIDANGALVGREKGTDTKVTIAYLCVATFANPMGLEKEGGNIYVQTPGSGEAQKHIAGSQSTNAGILNPGTLEMSNVDIAAQFTDMIVTQRGFQANSRIITVSDQMLEELVNIKR